MGLFDGFFSDPGKSTGVPAGFVKASHILLTGEDAAEQAEALKARIEAGEVSFSDAASQQSDCPSKGKGGDLGIFNKLGSVFGLPYADNAEGVAAFDDRTSAAPLGEIEIVTTSFGTHLLRVDGRN